MKDNYFTLKPDRMKMKNGRLAMADDFAGRMLPPAPAHRPGFVRLHLEGRGHQRLGVGLHLAHNPREPSIVPANRQLAIQPNHMRHKGARKRRQL